MIDPVRYTIKSNYFPAITVDTRKVAEKIDQNLAKSDRIFELCQKYNILRHKSITRCDGSVSIESKDIFMVNKNTGIINDCLRYTERVSTDNWDGRGTLSSDSTTSLGKEVARDYIKELANYLSNILDNKNLVMGNKVLSKLVNLDTVQEEFTFVSKYLDIMDIISEEVFYFNFRI